MVEDQTPRIDASTLTIDDSSRKFLLAGAFVTAGCIIGLEVALFQVVMYVSSYLSANQVISIALLGLSIGSLAAFYLARRKSAALFVICSLLFAVSIVGDFFLVLYFSSLVPQYDYLLLWPFVFGGIALSMSFAFASSNRVYFADLAGAGLSTLLIAFLIGTVREENALFVLAGVALLGSLAYTRLITADRSRRRWTVVVAASIVAVVILVAANLRLDFLNMAEDARTVPGSGGRVFWHVNHEKYQPAEVLFSRSSVAGRSDLIAYTMDWKERRITARQTCENSKIIDTVRRKPVKRYAVDPRLVAPDLIENPDTLIIGTSGEGVLKPVRALGRGKVFGVEINPAVYKMFTREAAELCDYCYDDVSMQIIDARSYLKQTDRHFDYITLMNAHFTKGNRADRVADPEYLQTVEAIKDYFAHLTDEGAILIEERDHNSKVNQRQILRLMYTMFVAMHELGIEHPERHLFLWSWEGTARNSLFIQFLVKKSEITRRDHDVMLSFFDDLALSRKPCGLCRGAKLVYSPFDESGSGNRYADFIGLSMAEKENFQKKKVNISANTDDRPFPWNVNRRTKPLDAFLRHFLLLSLVPFLPIAAVFVLRYRRRQMETVPHLFFFALIGVGYLVVEIALMQKFNHFLGSPTYSLIVILGGMLVCSGVGEFLVAGMDDAFDFWALVAVPVLLVFYRYGLAPILGAAQRFPLPIKIVVALATVGPLAFAMGIPFPFGLNVVKRSFSDEYAALMFGLNGIFASLGTPLSMKSSVEFGFSGTFLLGTALYAAVVPFFLWIVSASRGVEVGRTANERG